MADFTLHFKFAHEGKTYRFTIKPFEHVEPVLAVRIRVISMVGSIDKQLQFYWRDADRTILHPLETPEDLDEAVKEALTPKGAPRGLPCIKLEVVTTLVESGEQTAPELRVPSPSVLAALDYGDASMTFDEAVALFEKEQVKFEEAEKEMSDENSDEQKEATCPVQALLAMMQEQERQRERAMHLYRAQERALYYSPEECGDFPFAEMLDESDTRPYLYTPPPFATSGYADCTAPCCVPVVNKYPARNSLTRPVCSYSGYTGCLFSCCDATAPYAVVSPQNQAAYCPDDSSAFSRPPSVECNGCEVCTPAEQQMTDVAVDENLANHEDNDDVEDSLKERVATLEMALILQEGRFEHIQNLMLEKMMELEEMIKN